MTSIYLDNAATTKVHEEVIDAMMPYFTDFWYNPSSLYNTGAKVREDINKARENIADFIGADAGEIFFTSGGSEGNCWAIQGFVNYCRKRMMIPVVITSKIEHKSISECVKSIDIPSKFKIQVDKYGFINIKDLDIILSAYDNIFDCKVLVSIQFANSEIGTIQNIKKISDVVHKHNAVFHTDAVQAFGQVPIDVKYLGVDMLTASGHKIQAPKGIGFLYKRKGIFIDPIIYGSQENGMRGSTENVPYIIGLSKAVDIARKYFDYGTTSRNRDVYIKELEDIGCKLNGSLTNRLPNNINVILPNNISGETMLYSLDISNIYISTGSACDSKSIVPSRTLLAIGLTYEEANCCIRITIPNGTCDINFDYVLNEIKNAIKILSY